MCPKEKYSKIAIRSCLALATTLATISISPLAEARIKKVSDKSAANLLSMCMLEDDWQDAVSNPDQEGWVGCCSRTLGYCVECPSNGRGTCVKYPRRLIPINTRPKSPNSGKISTETTGSDHRGSAKSGSFVKR